MTTPSKNFNYNSPYANPVQQYPSQSEDYISLDMGGPTHLNNATSFSNEKTPGRYNPKYYQQSYRNSNSKANRRNLFNNYNQQSNRKSYNQQNYGARLSNERLQQHQSMKNNMERTPQQKHPHSDKKDTSIASYCHPSMTEDPWFELIQRIKALDKSKISAKDSSTPLGPHSNSNSDIEPEADSAASD